MQCCGSIHEVDNGKNIPICGQRQLVVGMCGGETWRYTEPLSVTFQMYVQTSQDYLGAAK